MFILYSTDIPQPNKQKVLQQASQITSDIFSIKRKTLIHQKQTKDNHLFNKYTIQLAWTNILFRMTIKTRYSNTLEITMVQTKLTMKLHRIGTVIRFH